MTPTKAQKLRFIEADIARHRAFHTKLTSTLISLGDALDVDVTSYLYLAKEENRRALARLRKAKSRLLTGRN